MQIFYKSLFLLLIGYWSWTLMTVPQPWIFLDGVNLMIHEFGHLLFAFAGQFVGVLGGTLLQCLVPVGVGVYFGLSGQWYALLFCVFWLGDNLVNVSVYMKDAVTMQLPLVGGGGEIIHDWNWLFSQLGILHLSVAIGTMVYALGILCILLAIVGLAYDLMTLTIKLRN